VQPAEAFFHHDAGEFILPYKAVRTAQHPDQILLDFLQSTYEAAAKTGNWEREALDCELGEAGKTREIDPEA
jgi:hypothetical protein